MNSRRNTALTLMELLIAIVLVSVIVTGFFSIDLFGRRQLLSSNRLAEVQNNGSYVLEHMTKNLSRAIGNETLGVGVVWIGVSNNINYVTARVDSNGNGIAEGWQVDYLSGYKLDSSTHKLSYCDNCYDSPCSQCLGNEEVLAQDITAFSASKNLSGGSNYITVDLTACWDPAASVAACNTPDNPSVTMSTRIRLPSVAAN